MLQSITQLSLQTLDTEGAASEDNDEVNEAISESIDNITSSESLDVPPTMRHPDISVILIMLNAI